MNNKKTKLSAVEGLNKVVSEIRQRMEDYRVCDPGKTDRNNIYHLYQMAVWIDANLAGGCVVDPCCQFHFYEEEDAMAFKLKW